MSFPKKKIYCVIDNVLIWAGNFVLEPRGYLYFFFSFFFISLLFVPSAFFNMYDLFSLSLHLLIIMTIFMWYCCDNPVLKKNKISLSYVLR